MVYSFGPFELDLATIELRKGGQTHSLERQVFALLALLVENRERLVCKEEIIDKVWEGRVVSDAAVASRVKSARQALGDDGKSQRFIRTIHGRGYRFVADVRAARGNANPSASRAPAIVDANPACAAGQGQDLDRPARPSVAVLSFRFIGDKRYAALATAVPDELIAELSRLRWLLVTARGSSFRLRAAETEFAEVGALLGVRYYLCGTVEVSGRSASVTVELIDTRNGGIVWADRYCERVENVHSMREQIRSRILVELDIHIPIHEATLARYAVAENLDAWSAYHVGLQHLYRFNRVDNLAATKLFQQAVALDPRFARAHAGLSFMHFQSAFMHYSNDTSAETGLARRCAERAVELDPLDPFVNFAMGRTYWLEGDLQSSLGWLERSTTICPHYAHGIYARAWTEALSARPELARQHVDLALRLSPLDPLHYAMLATRAFTHMAAAEDAEAATWADRAARSPGAHVLIALIAAAAHAMNHDAVNANFWAQNARDRGGTLTRNDFGRAFPMASDAMRGRVQQALAELGF